MVALYASSHYKNTPNDLILMSDAPAHHLFALLGPVDETQVLQFSPRSTHGIMIPLVMVCVAPLAVRLVRLAVLNVASKHLQPFLLASAAQQLWFRQVRRAPWGVGDALVDICVAWLNAECPARCAVCGASGPGGGCFQEGCPE